MRFQAAAGLARLVGAIGMVMLLPGFPCSFRSSSSRNLVGAASISQSEETRLPLGADTCTCRNKRVMISADQR